MRIAFVHETVRYNQSRYAQTVQSLEDGCKAALIDGLQYLIEHQQVKSFSESGIAVHQTLHSEQGREIDTRRLARAALRKATDVNTLTGDRDADLLTHAARFEGRVTGKVHPQVAPQIGQHLVHHCRERVDLGVGQIALELHEDLLLRSEGGQFFLDVGLAPGHLFLRDALSDSFSDAISSEPDVFFNSVMVC